MVVTFSFTVPNAKNLEKYLYLYGRKLPKHLRIALRDFSNIVSKSLRREFISGQKMADRTRSALLINYRKRGRNVFEVTVPSKLVNLDRAPSHFVSLKRGRRITQWANKYYMAIHIKTGLSKVRRGPRGAVIGGYIFATPHPFIDKGYEKVEPRLRGLLRKALKDTEKEVSRLTNVARAS